MTDFMKEYIQSVRMCSYLIEPPASEVVGNLCDHIEHLEKRIEELEQERRWISVDEKRPENWEKVIVVDSQNGILFSRFNGIKFLTIVEDKTIDDVIFWQPLPKFEDTNGK